jgi:hypothetical protein
MGTNYYLNKPRCPECGRRDRLHIGKSSYGWTFSLHVIPEKDINGLYDWVMLWMNPNNWVEDEYGNVVGEGVILRCIMHRVGSGDSIIHDSNWLANNHAQRDGYSGLIRHKIELSCIGHGDGPYDLIKGDFS